MRFSSDALLECYDVEHEILRRITPDVPVTTNFMNFFKPLDHWKWAEREDVVSLDNYPDPTDPRSGMKAAMVGDLMRTLGGGRPWILMEQTTHRVNWREINVAKAPGQMRHVDQIESYYESLFDANIAVDFARPGSRLSGYRLVLAPNLYLVGDRAAAELVEFVHGGGTLVMSFFSAIVDPNEHIRLGGY